jgi:hypothetical protein
MRTRLIGTGLGAAVLLLVGAGSGMAFAGHALTDVPSYTGCLNTDSGTVTFLKEGDVPRSPCPGAQTEVHLSGGDITQIVAGEGLVGGGDNGSVTISLAAGYVMPQDCADGQVVKWDGAGWACAGDDNTTYFAGTGLDLNGTQFSIEPGYRVHNGVSCSAGKLVSGIDASGNVTCADPPDTTVPWIAAKQSRYLDGDGVPDDNVRHTYLSVTPAAGLYVVNAKAIINSDLNITSNGSIFCRLEAAGTELDFIYFGPDNLDNIRDLPFALTAAVNLNGSQQLALTCAATPGADGISIRAAAITGVGVG